MLVKLRIITMRKNLWLICSVFALMFINPDLAFAAEESIPTTSPTLQILYILTILTLLPSIILMMTGFTRMIIVFSLLRNAMGLQQSPPNIVLVGLSLFLTLFLMAPTMEEIRVEAIQPYTAGEISAEEAKDAAIEPVREFMLMQTKTEDLEMFIELSGEEYEDVEEVPTTTIIPAFITSELRRAFIIGFLIYIPFLIIDMVVASVLMSMGMMMLPPMMISMPLKLLLFVLVDGWALIVESLIMSFN